VAVSSGNRKKKLQLLIVKKVAVAVTKWTATATKVQQLTNDYQNNKMEDNENMIESLLERVVEYGKTSYELVKLKTLDKTSDVVSSFIPHSVVFFLIASSLLFLNIGLAFWVGEILGKIYYGFFAIAAFYGIMGIVFRLFFYNLMKRKIENYIIKKALK
jgi:hypothetical protein